MESLKNSKQFGVVYQNGKSYANKYLVMYIYMHSDQTSYSRYGISISKKVGNSVVRHRICRLIREGFRLHESELKTGCDIVVVARAGAKGKGYEQICSALQHLWRLHGIMNGKTNE